MIIVGKGLIAKIFLDCKDINSNSIIFASGVSNSNENNQEEFDKEINLIRNTIGNNSDKKFIYFSSIFINRENQYYKHKLNIENFIQDNCKDYLIIRLPQLVGKGGNPNNIFNYFKAKISNNETLSIIKNSERSLVDIEHIKDFVLYCINKDISGIINFVKIEYISVFEIAKYISEFLNKKLNYIFLHKEEKNTNLENSIEVINFVKLKKINKKGYIKKTIKKYLNHG